jgi:hypothetical protein
MKLQLKVVEVKRKNKGNEYWEVNANNNDNNNGDDENNDNNSKNGRNVPGGTWRVG